VKFKIHGTLLKSFLPSRTSSDLRLNQSDETSVTLITERVNDASTLKRIMNDSDHVVFIRSEDIPEDLEIQRKTKIHRLESRRHFDGNIVSLEI
jgi:hypothetical protein